MNSGASSSSALIRQAAIALGIVAVLACTVLGSGVVSMQEGGAVVSIPPTATWTPLPILPTMPPTATWTPLPTATATATVAPGETPPTPAPPTETATPTATSTPLATATPACRPPVGWTIYVVRAGDTLTRLAYRHGTTIAAIVQANCLPSLTIYRGQRLYLPPAPVPPPPPTVTPTRCVPNPPPGWVAYTVRSGDTLSSLARSRGTTVIAIRQANCLGDLLLAGQVIYLPPAPPTVTPTWTLPSTATVEPTLTATETVTPTEPTTPTPTWTVTTVPTGTETVTPEPTETPTATVEPTPGDETPTATPEDTPTATTEPTGTPTEALPTLTPTEPVPPTPTEVPPTATQPAPTATPTTTGGGT